MDPRVWHKVGLEFCYINIDSSIKPKWSGQRRDDLRYQAVQIGVSGPFDV